MTSKGVMSYNLASASLFEPFGRTFVRFHFGHGNVLGINGRYSFDNHTIACGWDLADYEKCPTHGSILNGLEGITAVLLGIVRRCLRQSETARPWQARQSETAHLLQGQLSFHAR